MIKLRAENVTVTYENEPVIEKVNLTLEKGEIVSLLGASGCGKTTLGRTLMGLYPADGGSVCFGGREILGLQGRARKEFAKQVQMIFQDPIASLNPRMTVGEIVGEGLVIHGHARGKELDDKVSEILQSVGLPPSVKGRYPHEFSGGQRQRIGIARAVILQPKFIIADEPVSALDVSVQAQVINLLSDLKESMGLTVLFVAHDLSVVKYFCDRVAVMYAGQIVEIASSEELFRSPKHPYTKSLLSAIPQLNVGKARRAKRLPFEEKIGENVGAGTGLTEISKGHFVRMAAQE